MLRSVKSTPEKLLDNSIDTISNSEENDDKLEMKTFFTSTPKRVKTPCPLAT